MNVFLVPWLELAILIPLFGAVAVRFVREVDTAYPLTLGCAVASLSAALAAWVGHSIGMTPAWQPQAWPSFRMDSLNAPLIPLIALLHVLTILTTARVKQNRMSFTTHLFGESIRLATFSCLEPWPLIVLLALGILPPLLEMRRRNKSMRVFAIHMALFVVLLATGWFAVERDWTIGPALLLAAVLVRSGTVPTHLWVADLFEHATFGTALLFATPIVGMYVAVRLVIPVAPDWALSGIVIVSLVTAVLTAGVALVQTEARRFFAYFLLSQTSIVLIGLEIHSGNSTAGSLALWLSLIVSLGGLGLILRSLEARFGLLTFRNHRGLYAGSPIFAVGFALFGLGSVGFPGTMGFIASEVLLDGAIENNVWIGLVMVSVAALNGIAVMRVYFLLFTGAVRTSSLDFSATVRERVAILILLGVLFGCGLVPELFIGNVRLPAGAKQQHEQVHRSSVPPSQ